MKRFYLPLTLLAVVLYVLAFFATPFEPYSALGADTPSRLSLFSYILLPDEYFSAWLGPDGAFGLDDRLPILALATLCLVASAGVGALLLSSPIFVSTRFAAKTQANVSCCCPLTGLEFWLFATVLGLACFSHAALLFGLFGAFGLLRPVTALGCLAVPVALRLRRFVAKRYGPAGPGAEIVHAPVALKRTVLPGVLPLFAALLLLGGMIPSTDYDVLSYHLAGAREFAEAGRVGFQPHNVYANMPFGAEMFVVWGIVLCGDPFFGAMAGKTLIASTTLLTALGVYAFARRHFSETAGLVGMTLYLGTPWIVYVSTAGLVDSVVGLYAFFAIYALSPDAQRENAGSFGAALSGCLAGAAAACKYPAMLFVVAPLGLYLLGRAAKDRRAPVPVLFFALGVLAACGGWYVKNVALTGNPVYPLCFSIFGDTTGSWDAAVDRRWTAAHGPHGFGPAVFVLDFVRVVLTSPWNGAALVPLCLASFFVLKNGPRVRRRLIFALFGWTALYFAAWWLLTHRIDRFWLPVVPVLAALGGAGACFSDEKIWKRTVATLLVLGTVYGLIVSGLPAPGKSALYLAPLDAIRRDPGVSTPWAAWFNEHRPPGAVLLVGEAKAFLYDVPIRYSTCWNKTPLEEIADAPDPLVEFRRRDIAYVLVDWAEIRRFRGPGNYGFPDFVQQSVFDRLVADGVLERFRPADASETPSTDVYRVMREE